MTRKGWLLFGAISLFWGIPYLFIKIAVQALDPTVVVFARVAIAAAVTSRSPLPRRRTGRGLRSGASGGLRSARRRASGAS